MIRTLFVLDIDDTLTKSEVQHLEAFIGAMRHFGIIEINQNWPGYRHVTDSFVLKENYENNLRQPFEMAFLAEFQIKMFDILRELSPVSALEGAARTVEAIQSASSVGMCCATGSLEQPALLKLRQAGIPLNGRPIVGSNKHLTREAIVSQAIENAKNFYDQTTFERIFSVGDGIWDLRTARNLGLNFIGIGEKNLVEMEREGVAQHIRDWNDFDLADFLNK